MANTRIKDISTAASTLNSDDFIAVDGNTAGTRKMAKADLITEVSSGVSGTYLEESNNLSDVASKDTSKLNLEVPDVGTAPNEVPLNGQLGSMAYQSADSVAMGTVSISDKIDGSVEIADADNCTLTLRSDSDNNSASRNTQIMFQVDAGTTKGLVSYDQDADVMQMSYGGNNKHLVVDSSGRVGIGGSPSELLHLTNATAGAGVDANIRFSPTTSTTRYAEIQAVNTDGNNNIDLRFFTAPAGTPVERLRIDSQGRVGVRGAPGSYANNVADDLVVGDATGNRGITISSDSASRGAINFGDAVTTGSASYRGQVRYDHSTNKLEFGTQSAIRWYISSSGDLVANGAHGIDFGSVAGGSGTPITDGGLLDDYEAGTFTPQVADATSGGNVGSAATALGSYTKVGRVVHFSIVLSTIDTTGMTSSNTFYIRNLPFVQSSGGTPAQLSVKTDDVTFDDGIVSSVVGGQSNLYLASLRSNNSDLNRTVGHLTSGAADVLISGTYIAA